MNNKVNIDLNWFSSWFDTSYYHILYKHRNDAEAQFFVRNLVRKLGLTDESVLDLGCGKGRHSIFLNSLGLTVLGVDLSPNSIAVATQSDNESLSFGVHDMRNPIDGTSFDVVFNLFTSFGYFDDPSDDIRVVKSIHSMLNTNGVLVMDFMNSNKVIENLVFQEEKEVDDILFNINRSFDGRFIFKDIRFNDNGKSFHFQERVSALKKDDFIHLLTSNGFIIEAIYGDFELNVYDDSVSDRLILIAKKNG